MLVSVLEHRGLGASVVCYSMGSHDLIEGMEVNYLSSQDLGFIVTG